jgi:type IV pilus assembly protein PilW
MKNRIYQRKPRQGWPTARRQAQGFTLVELMIAMVLGLIIIGGVISVFLANKQSYRTNEALSQVQDHGRTAFEFLARDIRMAGMTGCGNLNRIANVLNNGPNGGSATDWFADFSNSIIGYEGNQADPAVTTGTGEAERVAGTDSFQLVGIEGSGFSVESHQPTSAQFKINEASTDFQVGDIVVVCDPDHAAVMQITNYNSSNVTVVHNTGTGTPGNCSKGLGFPTQCSAVGNSYEFGPNSQIAKLSSTAWYIGNNPVGGNSLYRVDIVNSGGVPTEQATEMVRNVTDLQVTYLSEGGTTFQDADAVTNWALVDAARVALTMQSEMERAGTDQNALTRTLSTTVTVRNRVE